MKCHQQPTVCVTRDVGRSVGLGVSHKSLRESDIFTCLQQKMASKPELATAQTVSMAQQDQTKAAPVHDSKKGLSMTEQYARV